MVDVFQSGLDGYDTYRIPSIIRAANGDLIAFAEGRVSKSDHAENDIVLKTSKDNGKTWGKLVVLAEDGANSLNNPQVVVEQETGKIIFMYQRYPKGFHEREVVPGYTGDKICRNFVMYSSDNGKTWTTPKDITAQVKRPTYVTSLAGGPGIGIQLTRGKYKGRLIMPFNQGPYADWKVYAVFSDDKGETWQYGDIAPYNTDGLGNEVQMVELSDGSVMLNARNHNGNKRRKVAISTDGGQNWTGLADDKALLDSQCMGSVLRFSFPEDGRRSILLFANPATESGRTNGTVRMSFDEGNTWPVSRQIYAGSYAYSVLVKLSETEVGVFFERDDYTKISFSPFTIDWLRERSHSTYYFQKKTQFDLLPDTPNEIIMLGNSITDIGLWEEWFPNVNIKNRGISGDVTDGVLYRLNEITSSKPKKIFIMIGVNDLALGMSPDEILVNYKEILGRIKKESPKTDVFIQSTLPVNESIKDFWRHSDKGPLIKELNSKLEVLAKKEKVKYVDLYSSFIDENGQMNLKFTNDGLHINGEGYKLWCELIKDKVNK